MSGPLDGVRVLEIGGIGPTPFAGMILADMGAEVIRVDRPGGSLPLPLPPELDLANRGKRMISLDLKRAVAVEAVLKMVESADILIEGYRPGVAERLGIGPEQCRKRNVRLVFGRMTGWGQDGPWAAKAGHDANYIGATGALHAIGPRDGAPSVPLNLLGDYGGGSTYLVMGVLAALWRARVEGQGDVVDAAIVDGTAHLMAGIHSFNNAGMWVDERQSNVLDGAAPFYGMYRTADNRHMAVAGIELPFFREMCERLGVDIRPERLVDRAEWAAVRDELEAVFETRTQADWAEIFRDSDACVSPVLTVGEAVDDPHLVARGTFVRTESGVEPAPTPRFERRASGTPPAPRLPGADTREVLEGMGLDAGSLIDSGAAFQLA